MRPCDFKMGKLLASLQIYRCTYNFEMRFPIFHVGASDSSTFEKVIRNGIACHAKELHNAKSVIDGKLASVEQPITSEGTHNVELLLPFMRDSSAEVCNSNEVSGLAVLTGSICASAYLGPKEPTSQAISDLKGDIISSLQSRLDIIYDDAEDKVDLTSNYDVESSSEMLNEKAIHQPTLQELRKPCTLQFPKRVFVPWSDGIFICDYLQPLDNFEDLKDRCKEMMSMESPIESSEILEPETEANSFVAKSFWDVIHSTRALPESRNLGTSTGIDASESKTISFNYLAALLLLVAVLVGSAIRFIGQ